MTAPSVKEISSPVMNIFKRELTLYTRSKLFLLLTPLFVFIPVIWYFFILDSFDRNILDIKAYYNIFPTLLAVTIPLLTQGIWLRDKQRGLEGLLIQSSVGCLTIVLDKIKAVLLIVSLLIFTALPIIIVLSFLGYVDYGQLFLINAGLILMSLQSICIGFLFSVLLRSRILCYFLTMMILLMLTSIPGFSQLGFISFDKHAGFFFNGVLNLKSLFFFISLSTILFFIIVMIINKRINIKSMIVSLLLIPILFIPGSFDLTTLGSYSLTETTKQIFSDIEGTISLTYYHSRDLEKRSGNISAIKSALELYKKLKGCELHVVTDESKDFKKNVGLSNPYPIEDDLYSFIVIEYNNAKRIIPLVAYAEELEFSILKTVDDMLNGKKHVAIMPGNEGYTEDSFSMLYKELKESFNVSFIFPGDRIPADVQTLIVAGHFAINYDTLSMIGDYLGTGGNILIAGTGLPTDEGLVYRETPVLAALKYCGVEIEPYLIGDNNNVGLIDEDGRVTPYPLNVVTDSSSGVYNSAVFPFSGFDALYLSPVLAEKDRFVPLLSSSHESWLVNLDSGIDGTPEGAYTAAAYGVGEFAQNFSGIQDGGENRMLVLGNSLSLTDMSYSLGIDNGYNFILRSVYLLNGDENMLYSLDKILWEKRFFKVDSSFERYLFDLLKIIFVIIYPGIILGICLVIKKS